MRKVFLSIVWMFLCVQHAQAEAIERPLRACEDQAEYPPFVYYQRTEGATTRMVTGYTMDILQMIPATQRIHADLMPWKRCLEEVKKGDNYQIVMDAGKNSERESEYIFSDPIFYIESRYYFSKKKFPKGIKLKGLADIKNFRVCGLSGYTYAQYGLKEGDIAITASRFDQMVHQLMANRCEIFIGEYEVIRGYRLIDADLRVLIDQVELGNEKLPGIAPVPRYLMVSRALPDAQTLVDSFNKGFAELSANGTVKRLLVKYLGNME